MKSKFGPDQLIRAYHLGQDDFYSGKVNPYAYGPLADAWQRGWNYSDGYQKSNIEAQIRSNHGKTER